MPDVDGPWEPMTVAEVRLAFAEAPCRWWVAGGRALELGVGRSWRDHDDTDVSLCRADLPMLGHCLPGWQIWVAAGGALRPWSGGVVFAAAHENNLWCRRDEDSAWCLDVTVSDGDDRDWVYRRDPSVRVRWDQAVRRSADGVPYLAPALQLLFKSTRPRPKDQLDAEVVIPLLDSSDRAMLDDVLPADHSWRALLS